MNHGNFFFLPVIYDILIIVINMHSDLLIHDVMLHNTPQKY